VSPKGHHSNDVSRIYGAALELPDADRLAYVRRECAGDEALQRQVESLLAWNADVGAPRGAGGGGGGAPRAPPPPHDRVGTRPCASLGDAGVVIA
jgi:hypothetical protein